MEQLAWSDGTKPIRSKKEDKTKYVAENQEQQEERNSIEQTCILREPSSKREDANEKINEREMIGQTCQNPFFTNTSYVEDLDVQQNFLIPRSSHQESI